MHVKKLNLRIVEGKPIIGEGQIITLNKDTVLIQIVMVSKGCFLTAHLKGVIGQCGLQITCDEYSYGLKACPSNFMAPIIQPYFLNRLNVLISGYG